MKTSRMNLMLSASAVALSLALAGCGGGGGPQSNLALYTPPDKTDGANNDPVNTGGSPQNSGGSTSANNDPVNTGGSPQSSGGSTSANNDPVNTGGSPQNSGGSTSANNDPVNTGGSPQNSGGSTSANNDPVNTGGSPQNSGGSTSANNDPVNTGGSPQNSGGSTSANNDPVNTGGSPQSSGGSTSANNDPVNTGGSPQSSGGSTSANNDPVNTGGSPQSNTDDNNPVNTASNNNDNIGVSPGGDGPSRAQENTSPTAAERAKAAAEAAEEKIDQAAQGPLTDFFQGRTLSKAMGVSANIGAGDAVRAVSTIEREIAAVRRHLTTATNSATTLRTRADRLREAEAEHEMRLEEADDTAVWDMLMEAFTEAEDAARDVESAIAAVDYYVNGQEESAQAADELAALLEAGGPECDYRCPGPGNPPNLDGVQDGRFYRPGAKATRQEAANLRKDAREYKALPITYDGTEYTYSRLKSIATSKRRAADAEKRKVDAKQAEIDRLSERLIQAEEDTKSAEEAAATAEDQAGEIEAILKPLEDSLEVWEGVVAGGASALESAKAKQVLDLLALTTSPVGVFLPTGAIADLDTTDHVFARASNKPARTMTFEDIANGNEAWVYHRRSFLNSDGTAFDDRAHDAVNYQNAINIGGTGLPRNHPAIALSGLDTTVFVKQDGTSPSYPNTPTERQNRLGFDHGKLNGIEGTLYCDRGQGCSTYTKSSTTEFLDGWYFTPAVHESRQTSLGYNPAEASFEDSDNDGTYEPVSYVDYGMWLEGADDALKLHRRANLVGPNVGPGHLDFYVGIGANNDLSATYNGKARGLSARTRGSRTASGHFTADVELVATFLNPQPFENSSLKGTIDNFRAVAGQGSGHVDPGWSISLLPAPINATTGVVTPAYAKDGSLNNPTGGWNATAYGANRNERPDGFYGGFNTMFCDGECNAGRTNVVGAAAGLYHVEKQ